MKREIISQKNDNGWNSKQFFQHNTFIFLTLHYRIPKITVALEKHVSN